MTIARPKSHFSPEAALEVLSYFSSQSHNVQYIAERDELMVSGLGFREIGFVTDCLLALGAQKQHVTAGDTDDGVVTLSSACSLATMLAMKGVNFVGRAKLPAGTTRS